jgi:hypothetical protein
MEKQESKHKAAVMKILRQVPHYVALRHEDLFTSGIPDISLSGMRHTSWWEFKHATPKFESKGIQELTCKRLAAHGYRCHYVICYQVPNEDVMTYIVHPDKLHKFQTEARYWTDGINYKWIAKQMIDLHEYGF